VADFSELQTTSRNLISSSVAKIGSETLIEFHSQIGRLDIAEQLRKILEETLKL
jgi:hypothetical protein